MNPGSIPEEAGQTARSFISAMGSNPHAHSAPTTGPHTHGHVWSSYLGQNIAPITQIRQIISANWEPAGSAQFTGTDFILFDADVGITVNAVGNIGISVSANGGGPAMPLMQPTTFSNMMIKL